MSVLERYKKPGGFAQLLGLLETCGPTKRDKFFQMILEENAAWHDALKQRLMSLETILCWPQEFLNEVTSRCLPITLTAISKNLDEEQNKRLFAGLSHSQFAKIRELSENKTFMAIEIQSATEKFLTDTRALITTGIVRLEKFEPDLAIPDGIEEELAKTKSTMPGLPPAEVFKEKATSKMAFTNNTAIISAATSSNSSSEEVINLKRQMGHIQNELYALKVENQILKDKLDKIKRIA